MSYEVTGRRRPTKVKKQINTQKRKRDDVDVHKLEQAVNELVYLLSSKLSALADMSVACRMLQPAL